MSGSKRLGAELRNAVKLYDAFWDGKEDVALAPDGKSLKHWSAVIRGPQGTPFEGGVFRLKIVIPSEYPSLPPKMVFKTPIIHPNIHLKTGEICINILKDQWSPAWSMESACRAIVAMLASPEADSPLNCDAGNLIRANDLRGYRTLGKMVTMEYATDIEATRLSFPEIPEDLLAQYAVKKKA